MLELKFFRTAKLIIFGIEANPYFIKVLKNFRGVKGWLQPFIYQKTYLESLPIFVDISLQKVLQGCMIQ